MNRLLLAVASVVLLVTGTAKIYAILTDPFFDLRVDLPLAKSTGVASRCPGSV